MLSRFLGEPLLHFLVAGTGIFGVFCIFRRTLASGSQRASSSIAIRSCNLLLYGGARVSER